MILVLVGYGVRVLVGLDHGWYVLLETFGLDCSCVFWVGFLIVGLGGLFWVVIDCADFVLVFYFVWLVICVGTCLCRFPEGLV